MKLTHIPYFVLFAFITVFTDSLYAQGILSSGTLVVVKPEKNWDSLEKNSPNFIVAYPIKDNNGNVVVNGGAPVELSADWRENKGVGKAGKVDLSFQSVRGVNGTLIPINGNYSDEGENKKGLAHGLTWGLFFTVLGPLSLPCLAIKGEPAEINQSLTVNTYVLNDTKIE